MASINTGKMLLAGVAAFVVLYVADGLVNGVLLADQWAAYQKSIGKAGEFSGGQLGIFAVLDLIAGMAVAWIYASIRPRFGSGPATAVRAGLLAWVLTALLPNSFLIASEAMPANLLWVGIGFAVVQYVLAALVAGFIYKEEAAPAARRASA